MTRNIIEVLNAWHKQAHSGDNPKRGSVRRTVEEKAEIASVVYGSDGVYVRVKRQGQTVPTRPIRWFSTSDPQTGMSCSVIKYQESINTAYAKPIAP